MNRTGAPLHKLKMGAGFVVFSAVFGPFLLMDPPRFGGFNRREWLAIAIGFAAWGLVLEGIFGIPSAISNIGPP